MKKTAAVFCISVIISVGLQAQIISDKSNLLIQLRQKKLQSNSVNEVYDYFYNAQKLVSKIKQTQEGKLTAVTDSFVYNKAGLLTSYLKTYTLDISPERTNITYYDNSGKIKRIEINRTQNTKAQPFVASWDYTWYKDSVVVTDTRFFLGRVAQKFVYQLDNAGNILVKQGLGEASIASTTLYTGYDTGINPGYFIRGYADANLPCKHNCTTTEYKGSYTIYSAFEYLHRTVHQHIPGGAKIPDQKINTGIVLKETQTAFDKDSKKIFTVAIITYTYTNMTDAPQK